MDLHEKEGKATAMTRATKRWNTCRRLVLRRAPLATCALHQLSAAAVWTALLELREPMSAGHQRAYNGNSVSHNYMHLSCAHLVLERKQRKAKRITNILLFWGGSSKPSEAHFDKLACAQHRRQKM
eukprot:6175429-Pleurochrysis_carterae.AAC.2